MLFGPASATEPDAEPEVAFLLQSVDVDVGAALLRVRTWHSLKAVRPSVKAAPGAAIDVHAWPTLPACSQNNTPALQLMDASQASGKLRLELLCGASQQRQLMFGPMLWVRALSYYRTVLDLLAVAACESGLVQSMPATLLASPCVRRPLSLTD